MSGDLCPPSFPPSLHYAYNVGPYLNPTYLFLNTTEGEGGCLLEKEQNYDFLLRETEGSPIFLSFFSRGEGGDGSSRRGNQVSAV